MRIISFDLSADKHTMKFSQIWFICLISIIEVMVFIVELGLNWSYTGSPIQIKPSVNPLIGPSAYVLIHIGAKFEPCIHEIEGITNDDQLRFPCPNYTGSIDQDSCDLIELCGFGGRNNPPNQWYRFILPIFLHGGLIHLIFNIVGQLILGIPVEKNIGSCRLAVIYFISGIFGNIISVNFAPSGSASVGSSGALFAILALFFLKLIFNWKKTSWCQFISFIISILIDLALGLLPMIDNFTHIAGFIMGCLLGVTLWKTPETISEKPRSKKWYFWLIFRLLSLLLAIGLFLISILNIYRWNVKCHWCQYINCIPVNDWCEMDHLKSINSTLT